MLEPHGRVAFGIIGIRLAGQFSAPGVAQNIS